MITDFTFDYYEQDGTVVVVLTHKNGYKTFTSMKDGELNKEDFRNGLVTGAANCTLEELNEFIKKQWEELN